MNNASNLGGFIAKLESFGKEVLPAQIVAFQKKLALELFARILRKTPVDKGFLRGAWTVSIGDKSTANAGKSSAAKNGDDPLPDEISAMQSALDQIAKAKVGVVVWIANAMPYVLKVEFGGYPNPAQRGTYVKSGSRLAGVTGPAWVIRTSNGFSLQAPQGIVQVSLAEIRNWITTELAGAVTISD